MCTLRKFKQKRIKVYTERSNWGNKEIEKENYSGQIQATIIMTKNVVQKSTMSIWQTVEVIEIQ